MQTGKGAIHITNCFCISACFFYLYDAGLFSSTDLDIDFVTCYGHMNLLAEELTNLHVHVQIYMPGNLFWKPEIV
jgi:hypothetical protein